MTFLNVFAWIMIGTLGLACYAIARLKADLTKAEARLDLVLTTPGYLVGLDRDDIDYHMGVVNGGKVEVIDE